MNFAAEGGKLHDLLMKASVDERQVTPGPGRGVYACSMWSE